MFEIKPGDSVIVLCDKDKGRDPYQGCDERQKVEVFAHNIGKCDDQHRANPKTPFKPRKIGKKFFKVHTTNNLANKKIVSRIF